MPESSTVEQFLKESKEYLRESASEESSESEISPMKSNLESSGMSASADSQGSPLYANTTSNSANFSNRPMSNLAPMPETVEEEKDDVYQMGSPLQPQYLNAEDEAALSSSYASSVGNSHHDASPGSDMFSYSRSDLANSNN